MDPGAGRRDVAPLVVVMGVSGVGKSTVGRLLAEECAVAYADGDDFHTPASIASMARGVALTEADRWPWLDRIGTWLAAHEPVGGVVSCSALRRVYRERLVEAAPRVSFLHLVADPMLLRRRMLDREHFMAASLLDSQLDLLEPLAPDEPGTTLDSTEPPAAIVRRFLARCGEAG